VPPLGNVAKSTRKKVGLGTVNVHFPTFVITLARLLKTVVGPESAKSMPSPLYWPKLPKLATPTGQAFPERGLGTVNVHFLAFESGSDRLLKAGA